MPAFDEWWAMRIDIGWGFFRYGGPGELGVEAGEGGGVRS